MEIEGGKGIRQDVLRNVSPALEVYGGARFVRFPKYTINNNNVFRFINNEVLEVCTFEVKVSE